MRTSFKYVLGISLGLLIVSLAMQSTTPNSPPRPSATDSAHKPLTKPQKKALDKAERAIKRSCMRYQTDFSEIEMDPLVWHNMTLQEKEQFLNLCGTLRTKRYHEDEFDLVMVVNGYNGKELAKWSNVMGPEIEE